MAPIEREHDSVPETDGHLRDRKRAHPLTRATQDRRALPGPPGALRHLPRRVNNQWYGPVAGVWLGVYAGGPTTPNEGTVAYGAVRLLSVPIDPNAPDPTMTEIGDFAPSPRTGWLTIRSVSGTTMTLTDPTGNVMHFDLVTHSFRPG